MAGSVRISTLATRINAEAAAVATAINSTPATTTAEVQALAALMQVMALRPDLTVQLMKLNASGSDDLIPS